MSDLRSPALRPSFSRGSTTTSYSSADTARETLLGTPTTKNSFFRTWFATSADLLSIPGSHDVKWGIHWKTPVSMIMFFLFGALSAATHHIYYRMLHGTDVGNASRQQWVLWIGSFLSFLTRGSLLAVLGIARTQWVWVTLREKFMTMGGIDALFAVSTNPTCFANRNMLRNAKIATVMAVIMWILPIPVILTPGTMTVTTVTLRNMVPCSVRSMVFSYDSNSTAKRIWEAGINPNISVATVGFWSEPGPGGVRAPASASVCNRVFVWSAYTGIIERPHRLNLEDGYPEVSNKSLAQICGSNCEYMVQFLGPALSCTELASRDWDRSPWESAEDFMDSFMYRAARLLENNFVVGFRPARRTGRGPTVVLCDLSIARYTVRNLIQRGTFLEPIIEKFEQSPLPVPQDLGRYPDATYLTHRLFGSVLYRILSGNITSGRPTDSRVTLTTLIEDMAENNSNLASLIESRAQKMIVSLLSIDGGGANSTDPLLDVAAVQDTTCITTRLRVFYNYSAPILVIVYVTFVAFSLLMTLAGFFALAHNGVASGTWVSSIIRTTRNPTLDMRIGGSCLGGHPVPKELEKLELRFGVLNAGAISADGEPIASFALGMKEEVKPIRRGMQYS